MKTIEKLDKILIERGFNVSTAQMDDGYILVYISENVSDNFQIQDDYELMKFLDANEVPYNEYGIIDDYEYGGWDRYKVSYEYMTDKYRNECDFLHELGIDMNCDEEYFLYIECRISEEDLEEAIRNYLSIDKKVDPDKNQ